MPTRYIVAIALGGAALGCATSAAAFPDGAPWGSANPATERNCADCHFESEPILDSGFLQIIGLPERAVPNVRYELTIRCSDPSTVISGFQLMAVSDNAEAGRFSATANSIETIGSSARTVIPQTSDGGVEWTISWQAPEKIEASIGFYLAASAANDDGSPFGDLIHFRSFTVHAD